ncbi:MAG: 50S ribosomal protein L2 [Phycisphaerae bacterium]|nr:50S ribosomal protein L2 [Phycisphaerae bacterium]
MAVKNYNPTSAGRRFGSVNSYSEITRTEPEKSLLEPLKKTGGRNHHGVATAKRRGGGNKRRYRRIDFRRDKDGVPAKVASIEYDPNRTAFIALLHYADGEKRYILAPIGLKVGDVLESGEGVEPRVGNAMPLSSVPVSYEIHNIEVIPGQGGKMVRSAGNVARLIGREGPTAHIQLPSGEIRMLSSRCRATIGQVGNLDHAKISLGKAGRNRHVGRRPRVRAIAKNPVDHPMGGGEGRSKSGKHPQSATGVLAKGGKTRKPKKASNSLIMRRRRSKRYGQLTL